MHIAICRLLEPYGFYEFEFFDEEGWPHYKVKEELPPLKAGEQSVLMKDAIVNYFLERELIDWWIAIMEERFKILWRKLWSLNGKLETNYLNLHSQLWNENDR